MVLAFLGKGAYKILKLPFRMTSGLIFSLEKLGDTARYPLKDKSKNKTKSKISNPATGLLIGTSSMVNEILTAISGLVVEPMKGMKRGGIKGGVTGVGKGIYGLIVKPVAGTIDMVTMTARGVGNMPGTLYKNMFKLKRKKNKKKKNPGLELIEEEKDENMEKLAENDEEILYINKNNPFGVEKIKEITRNLKQNIELDDENFHENNHNNINNKKNEEDSEEVQRVIKFYKTQNSKNSMDFQEDMCEFIIISPDVENPENTCPLEIDLKNSPKQTAQQMESPKKSMSNSPIKKNSETLPMFLPKEFLISDNPFNKVSRQHSNSLNPPSPNKLNMNMMNNSIDNLKLLVDEPINHSSSDESDKKSEESFEAIKKEDSIQLQSSESSESEENEEILIKYKVPFPYSKAKGPEIWKLVNNLTIIDAKDEARCENSHKSGGHFCPDQETIKNIRSLGKEIIKEIGRKIISGSFNLTTISFPIKCMIPKSALETIFQGTCFFPLYMNKAALTKDPLERFKYVITCSLASFYLTNSFAKPLNPYLGETFNGSFNDGTKLYSEQISHHPPISYFLVLGPNKNYRYWGHYLYEVKAGLNTLTFSNKGNRIIRFHDGQEIDFTFGEEYYSGNFMGTMKHETLGYIDYHDKKNNIACHLKFASVKKKPSDYFESEIFKNNKPVSKIFGSYRGFIEFDGKRYWDYRYVTPFKCNIEDAHLLSDHRNREDLQTLKKGQIKLAQQKKEALEEAQRRDAKLRKEFMKNKFQNHIKK